MEKLSIEKFRAKQITNLKSVYGGASTDYSQTSDAGSKSCTPYTGCDQDFDYDSDKVTSVDSGHDQTITTQHFGVLVGECDC